MSFDADKLSQQLKQLKVLRKEELIAGIQFIFYCYKLEFKMNLRKENFPIYINGTVITKEKFKKDLNSALKHVVIILKSDYNNMKRKIRYKLSFILSLFKKILKK
jgi:hypothetical protein